MKNEKKSLLRIPLKLFAALGLVGVIKTVMKAPRNPLLSEEGFSNWHPYALVIITLTLAILSYSLWNLSKGISKGDPVKTRIMATIGMILTVVLFVVSLPFSAYLTP